MHGDHHELPLNERNLFDLTNGLERAQNILYNQVLHQSYAPSDEIVVSIRESTLMAQFVYGETISYVLEEMEVEPQEQAQLLLYLQQTEAIMRASILNQIAGHTIIGEPVRFAQMPAEESPEQDDDNTEPRHSHVVANEVSNYSAGLNHDLRIFYDDLIANNVERPDTLIGKLKYVASECVYQSLRHAKLLAVIAALSATALTHYNSDQ